MKRKTLPGARAVPRWLLVFALALSGVGAAVGTALSSKIGGNLPFTASQAILIDKENFDEDDISEHVAKKIVAVSDDGSSFTVGVEIHNGEEVAIDLPLMNLSDQDITASITLNAEPPLQVYVKHFWSQQTKTKTPSPTCSTPSPAPVTTTDPQTSDAPNKTNEKPDGSATINPQSQDGTETHNSADVPGTPSPSPLGSASLLLLHPDQKSSHR